MASNDNSSNTAGSSASKFLTAAASVGLGFFIARKWYTKRKVIAVDMDEVLCQFVDCITRWMQQNYDKSPADFDSTFVPLSEWIAPEVLQDLKPSDYVSYLFNETWCCSFDQATQIVDSFLNSSFFSNIANVKLVDGSVEHLLKLQQDIEQKFNNKVDLVIVTSRQSRIEDLTRAFIKQHFVHPRTGKCVFKDIVFGNHFGRGKKVSKPELCKKLGACMLIDDSLKYCQQCAPVLEKVLLFDWRNAYQWSKQKSEFDAGKAKKQDKEIGSTSTGKLKLKLKMDVIGKLSLESMPLHPNIVKVDGWEKAYREVTKFLEQSI